MKAKSKAQSLGEEGRHPRFRVSRSATQRPAAADYLSRFLCVGFALALLVTGCAGPRPLKGGKAVTTRKPAGVIEQTLVQGENPSQAEQAGPGDRQGADLHRARRLAGGTIPDVGGRASPRAQTSQDHGGNQGWRN